MLPHLQRLNVLIAELKRRQVFRAMAVYSVAAWAVIEVTATVLPVFFLPDWVVRVVVGVMVLGFPVVLVFAWAFDLTVEGVQRTGDNREAPPAATQFLHSLPFRATLVLLVVVLTGVAGAVSWHVWLKPGALRGPETSPVVPEMDATRLAVLYFEDFSPGGELGYLADGITEALLHGLSQIEALEVVSRNGVKPYRDFAIPLDSLAAILGVGSLVEGSVEGSGDRVVVTVQLVDGATGMHLLSERIQGRGEDVLALRDSIVGIAVRSLGRTLGQELRARRARRGSSDAEAWALYQEAHRLMEDADTLRWALGDTLSARRVIRQADSLLALAAGRDPRWIEPVLGRGWTARTLAGLYSASASRLDPGLVEAGIRQAEAALRMEPGNPEALELRGTLLADLYGGEELEDPEAVAVRAEADLRGALAADPSRTFAWVSLANLLRQRGDFEEASLAAQRALEADPFLINAEKEILFTLSQVWLDLGDLERANRWTDEGRRRFPAEPSFAAAKLVILAGAADAPESVDTARMLLRELGDAFGDPDWPFGRLQLAAVLAQRGSPGSARALVEEVRGGADPGPWIHYFEANVRLRLGQEEAALDLLESFLEEIPRRRAYIARDWWWTPLRDHPRFRALVGGPRP